MRTRRGAGRRHAAGRVEVAGVPPGAGLGIATGAHGAAAPPAARAAGDEQHRDRRDTDQAPGHRPAHAASRPPGGRCTAGRRHSRARRRAARPRTVGSSGRWRPAGPGVTGRGRARAHPATGRLGEPPDAADRTRYAAVVGRRRDERVEASTDRPGQLTVTAQHPATVGRAGRRRRRTPALREPRLGPGAVVGSADSVRRRRRRCPARPGRRARRARRWTRRPRPRRAGPRGAATSSVGERLGDVGLPEVVHGDAGGRPRGRVGHRERDEPVPAGATRADLLERARRRRRRA